MPSPSESESTSPSAPPRETTSEAMPEETQQAPAVPQEVAPTQEDAVSEGVVETQEVNDSPAAETAAEFQSETAVATVTAEEMQEESSEVESDASEPANESGSETDEERTEFVAAFDDSVDEAQFDATSEPFVGQWQQLVSSTNWEKGRIISEWRGALLEAGAHPTEYSDEAWARRAGGVTSPHVGRLRRVHDRFEKEHDKYPGLYWSHFLAALDWEDAPLWLEGAMRSGWSVSQLRDQRWQANGGEADKQPKAEEYVDADEDDDVIMPAQGGGRPEHEKGEPGDITAGPTFEGPDFGEEDDMPARGGSDPSGSTMVADEAEGGESGEEGERIQPFRNLPELPDDLRDAVESLKLAILRHKATKWEAVEAEDVVRYLTGLRMLVEARTE